MQISRWTIIILSLATFLFHAWPMWRWRSSVHQKPMTFSVSLPSISDDNHPVFIAEEFIAPSLKGKVAHASSICELSDGRLAAVWYAGSREGAKDVAIYFAMRGSGERMSWTKPRVIVNRDSATKELQRFVKKVGNSIIFADSEDRIWLIYVTISVGGWSGSSLNVKISDDGGMTWTQSQRLTLSPFFNVSELVRNNPLPMKDGGFGIPIYHECLGKFPEMLWIRVGNADQRITFKKTRMVGGRMFIQPSVVVYDSHSATAFYRNCSDDRVVGMAFTSDIGARWSKPRKLGLPNSDSALNALLLSEGQLLLAFNDSKRTRDNLSLAVSPDGGANWMRIAEIENNPGEEFSYPYMIRSSDGRIHLVYTWRRKRIKQVVFNENWINAKIKKASK
jgi:predicted neuraminidase